VRIDGTPDGGREVWAKVESYNPGASVKDRIALAMIEDAEARGALRPGQTVVEATSGNTGIGLAVVCAVKRYPLVLVIPENMSAERIAVVEALGSECIASPVDDGMEGSMHVAEAIAADRGAFMTLQFANPANPACHERTTGPEIWEAMGGHVGAFVAGVGTCGTITGVGRFLKRQDASIRVVAVEPATSAVLSGRPAGPHRIQGIGAGFIPPVLDRALLDGVETVEDLEAYETSQRLAREQGVFVGLSAGAAVAASLRVAAALGPGAPVVTLLPDSGERYLSLAPYFRY
jgi:cysteine synthase A